MKTDRRKGGIAPFNLNLAIGWQWAASSPGHFTIFRDVVLLNAVRRFGETQSLHLHGQAN